MKLSTLLVLNAAVTLAYGVGLLLGPGTVFSVYGLTPGPQINLAGQLLGVELVTVSLLCWFARNVLDGLAQRAIILALLIPAPIGVVVSLMGTLSGVLNPVGWSIVAIYLFFGLAYGYFQFMKPRPA